MKDDDNHILLLEKGKRGLLQIIFGRTGIIIVSLIVQILFLFAAFYKLEGFLPYFWGGNTLLSAAVVLFLFGNDDNPTIKLTWFFILAVLPVFGLILYVYIKTDLGHRLMIRRYNDILSQTEHFAPSESACSKEELPEELQSLASYLNSCGFPCYQNTQAQYFPLGDDAFEVMCDELQKAEHFIFLEYFIVREGYMWGRILEILKEKVNAGVEVRVLYDGTCAVALLPYSYPEKLEKLGIACKMFAPLRPFVSTHYNYRDHRKIMVIDGKIGFTGGINLSDEYINRTSRLGHWKDTAIALRGDAVRSLTLMFLQMWDVSSVHFTPEVYSKYLDVPQPVREKEPGYVIPYGDSPLDRNLVGEMVYMDIINRANRYVHIMTPYLIIDNEMITALTYAARRGVEVQLILPHVLTRRLPSRLRTRTTAGCLKTVYKFMSTSRASFTRRSSSAMTARRPSARSIWTTAACTTTLNAARTFMHRPKSQKLSRISSKRSPSASARTWTFSKTTRLCESSSAPACASSPRCCKK